MPSPIKTCPYFLACCLQSPAWKIKSMMRHMINTKAALFYWMCCLLWLFVTLLSFGLQKTIFIWFFSRQTYFRHWPWWMASHVFVNLKQSIIMNDTNYEMYVCIFQAHFKILWKSKMCVCSSTLFQCQVLHDLFQLKSKLFKTTFKKSRKAFITNNKKRKISIYDTKENKSMAREQQIKFLFCKFWIVFNRKDCSSGNDQNNDHLTK